MKWPNAADQLLATATRPEFGEAEREAVLDLCRRNGIDWKRVYSTARMHGVAPLVYRNLSCVDLASLGLGNGVVDRFKRSFTDNLVAKHYLREGLMRILRFFNERNLDVMWIKGGALNPFEIGASRYTVSRDVDLIIRSRKEELPFGLLAEINQLTDGYPLEFDFFGHHDVDMNGVVEIDYARVWDDAIPVHYNGVDFHLMSPEDALITACLNACRKRYFNLKALCAIDMLLQDRESIRWKDLTDKANDYRVGDIVVVALRVAQTIMGSTIPKDMEDLFGSNRVKKALINQLASRLSFSSLSNLYSGKEVLGRKVGPSLLLPYASYRRDQVWRKLRLLAGDNGAS